ncbi:hypothetical protein [Profundibacter amoris]|uniref:Uncharacterized protein n=1 Tax=Profundibacter amoris TaxID=2171755 RepID=A0A347UHK8_9RHOB|nr:hypothetical protein [Profundibacter amoris]AXX98336.1 hypothetical protein BAR1_10600 [Profundibacter amoris]
MRQQNGYSLVAERAIERVRQIADDATRENLSVAARDRLIQELGFHRETLEQAFSFRKQHGPAMSMADSDTYFSEKLGGMISFAEMAVEPERHGGNYSKDKTLDNIGHYSYLVARLVAANWNSISRRPKSDKTLKESSFEHREAMERLVNR